MENRLLMIRTLGSSKNILSITHQLRSFHTVMAKRFNTTSTTFTPATTSSDINEEVNLLRKSLQQLKVQKKQAVESLKEERRKAREEEIKAVEDLRPKRVPSAFLIYTATHFNEVKKEMLEKKMITDQAFVEVNKELYDRFSKLSENEKNIYYSYIQEEKERYTKQMEVYKQAKKKMNALSGAPTTGFMRFYKEVCPDIKAEIQAMNQKCSAHDMAKLASKRWKELDEGTKLKYKEQYTKEMAEFKQQRDALKTATSPSTPNTAQ
ncbi:predicted protein [Naegleria gruberi]|uniref:Predicted protein n=1 Tax=Naegleria gruberi TaxID=5762 RepID=D2VLV5_NAEGR|nr:uncharacterized protein NAEGRDRAFT_69913 [Naegleria gruberi]EFC42207.1 predicted protein [Naegleria gruberi]|eukprot:XP_002674951.1 predicted protein [Naegleria gruberi strain NEG-M]